MEKHTLNYYKMNSKANLLPWHHLKCVDSTVYLGVAVKTSHVNAVNLHITFPNANDIPKT